MRIYLAAFTRAFRRYSTYRAATAAGAFTNTVFGVIRASILIAVWRANPHAGGYDTTDAVTYCFLGQALIAGLAMFGGGLDLPERIRTGDVAIDLYRPVDFLSWWLAADFGRAGFLLLARGIPPFVVGALVFDVRLPSDATHWAAFAVAVVLAVLVSFAMRYLGALSGFWLLDSRGTEQVLSVSTMFFSGMLIPLVLFPGTLHDVAQVLPFAALIQLPTDIFLSKYDGAGLAGALTFSAFWAVALLLVGRALTSAATRKLVVQGG